MTVLERCKNLREVITQRDVLRRADKEAEAFRARVGELRPTRTQLAADVEKLEVLQRKGVAIIKPPLPTSALKVLKDCESSLAANPTETGRDFGRLKRSLEKVGEDLRTATSKALDLVTGDLPSIEENLLKQQELIPSRKDQVARIREKRDTLVKAKAIYLRSRTAQDLDQFLDKRNELRALAEELNVGDVPKEVLEFFKAERQGGAPLEKLTDTVRDWLAAQGQLKDLRIIFGPR
ncbi:MAG: hypothetical protein ABL967_15960 [Bryobacteraceae bacterium]